MLPLHPRFNRVQFSNLFYSRLIPAPRLFSSFPCRHASSTTAPGLVCEGEKGVGYRLIRPLGTQYHEKVPNIWLAISNSTPPTRYVLKQPSRDNMDEGTSSSQALNAFNREVATQRAFSQHLMIRDIVDYVPDSEPGGPMMVLRFHTETLREARHIRPLTLKEIKWIMSGVLLGIYAVHIKGVVYTDLRMENILISGLNHEEPNTDVRKIIVRLADCGSIRTASSKDIITSLPYRSPEVHFGKRWAQSTDVWSWGILLAQLLQAQVDFKSPGMYESLYEGSLEEQTVAVRDKLSIDFKLSLVPMYAEDEHTAKLLPPPQPEEAYKWTKNLSKKGVADEDLQFLLRVLHPDPKARLSIREILQSRYLD